MIANGENTGLGQSVHCLPEDAQKQGQDQNLLRPKGREKIARVQTWSVKHVNLMNVQVKELFESSKDNFYRYLIAKNQSS